MINDRELLQQALYYMDDNCGAYTDDYRKLIEAIRARLSQCERCGEVNPAEIHTCTPQEPQIKQRTGDCLLTGVCAAEGHRIQKPQRQQRTYTLRKWQGLTDDEILEEYRQSYGDDGDLTDVYFAHAIETKLKEKNT